MSLEYKCYLRGFVLQSNIPKLKMEIEQIIREKCR